MNSPLGGNGSARHSRFLGSPEIRCGNCLQSWLLGSPARAHGGFWMTNKFRSRTGLDTKPCRLLMAAVQSAVFEQAFKEWLDPSRLPNERVSLRHQRRVNQRPMVELGK
jgi:hypothetical protein